MPARPKDHEYTILDIAKLSRLDQEEVAEKFGGLSGGSHAFTVNDIARIVATQPNAVHVYTHRGQLKTNDLLSVAVCITERSPKTTRDLILEAYMAPDDGRGFNPKSLLDIVFFAAMFGNKKARNAIKQALL